MAKISDYLLTLLLGLLLSGCSETKDGMPDTSGTNYFPLNVGEYRVYKVDGVRYYSVNDSASFSYFLKESVVDTFTNLEHGKSYKILRKKKMQENDPWTNDSLWTARKDLQTAVMVENNVPIVKLSFPMKDSLSWDGNKLNDKFAKAFTAIRVERPYPGKYMEFENSSTVIHEYLPDFIVNWISKKEIFAENVGMVYKENVILIYNQDAIGAEIIESGIRYYMQIVEYGKE
ncbi:MAG: hypothetical protein MI975_03320 [Cytophagales bacterium]|nr:hypothetical protein [Cytophagales bacterium]